MWISRTALKKKEVNSSIYSHLENNKVLEEQRQTRNKIVYVFCMYYNSTNNSILGIMLSKQSNAIENSLSIWCPQDDIIMLPTEMYLTGENILGYVILESEF